MNTDYAVFVVFIGLTVVNLHNIRMALRLLDLLMEHQY